MLRLAVEKTKQDGLSLHHHNEKQTTAKGAAPRRALGRRRKLYGGSRWPKEEKSGEILCNSQLLAPSLGQARRRPRDLDWDGEIAASPPLGGGVLVARS